MRILLVDTPFRVWDDDARRCTFAGVQNRIPALGLAYLAAVAERDGHQVSILDATSCPTAVRLVETAVSLKPDLVGFNSFTPTFRTTRRIARRLREQMPAVTMVVGGPHATAAPEHALGDPVFDFAILGEAEETFRDLVTRLRPNDAPVANEIPGLAVREGGVIRLPTPRPPIKDLDALPAPARGAHAPLARYAPTPASFRRLPLAHLITSRGCPHQCVFCNRSVFGERYRQRSAASVMDEVDEVVHRHGAREIRFQDDCLTIDRGRLETICRGMAALRPRVPWTCQSTVRLVTPDLLRMLRAAGCWQILYGLESGDDRVLEAMGKGTTVAENRRAVLWSREAGIGVRADFLVGTPFETEESFQRTVALALELPLDFAHFNKFTPYPGTELYRRLIADGHVFNLDGIWNDEDHYDFIYVPPGFTSKRMSRLLDQATRRFYLRPGYLARRLISIRSREELMGHVKGLLTIGGL